MGTRRREKQRERDLEKDIMELAAAIKSNAERDNTFTLSVLQRAKEIILQQQAKLATYEDTGWVPIAERLPDRSGLLGYNEPFGRQCNHGKNVLEP